jgi:hypothetical protein
MRWQVWLMICVSDSSCGRWAVLGRCKGAFCHVGVVVVRRNRGHANLRRCSQANHFTSELSKVTAPVNSSTCQSDTAQDTPLRKSSTASTDTRTRRAACTASWRHS